MGHIGKKILIYVIGGIIVEIVMTMANNKLEGKTIFGRKMPMKEKTRIDWKGNIYIGAEDCNVA